MITATLIIEVREKSGTGYTNTNKRMSIEIASDTMASVAKVLKDCIKAAEEEYK